MMEANVAKVVASQSLAAFRGRQFHSSGVTMTRQIKSRIDASVSRSRAVGRRFLGRASGAALAGLCVVATALFAQDAPQPLPRQAQQQALQQRLVQQLQLRAQGDGATSGGLTFPQDRTTLRYLRQAQQLVETKDYTQAVALFGAILSRAEDFFFQPDENSATFSSIKAEVRRMIGALPPEGKQAYVLRYGADAAKSLEQAVAANDLAALMRVASDYFHTEAGYDASYLLGNWQLDHGQPFAASLAFGQLLNTERAVRDRYEPALSVQAALAASQAGLTDQAIATLANLRAERPATMLNWGDAKIPLPGSDAELAAWLHNLAPTRRETRLAERQWNMFRGDAARNAQASGGMPILNKQWEALGSDNVEVVEETIRTLLAANLREEQPLMPTLHPICVDETFIFRSPLELVAVDARTGKRLWNGAEDGALRKVLDAAESGRAPSAQNQPLAPPEVLRQTVQQRLWGDLTFGTITSDGRNVYCVEDLLVGGQNVAQVAAQGVWIVNGQLQNTPPNNLSSSNRLSAYSLKGQGKLVREWPVGYAGDPLQGAYFLGPPLPLGDALYVLAELGGAENNGALALVALDPQAAPAESVLWTQTLGVVEQSILYDNLRRTGGFSPSFAEGVLVCPTGSGKIIGFDLMSRSLLWGYSYEPSAGNVRNVPRMGRVRIIDNNFQAPSQSELWADNSLTIVGGKVLAAPQDSGELHCIDLLTGKSAWGETMIQREDSRYVAGVIGQTALLVGTRNVRAVSLENGQTLWHHQLPDQRVPAGRGFFHDDQYHLPLVSTDMSGEVNAEIALVNMAERSVRVPTDQQSRPAHVLLGNLICYDGAIFSQNPLGSQRYDRYADLMREVAARLKQNPRDVPALLQQASLFIHDSRFDEAVAQLRQAHEIANSDQTRAALLTALLDGLAADFPRYRADLPLLEQLVRSPEDRARLFRTLGDQLEGAGERVAAFNAYMELANINARGMPLHSISLEWLVRPDRWLRSKLADLRSSATPAEQTKMDQAIAEKLAQREGETPADLQRLLDYFGNLPAADGLRRRLITQLMAEDKPRFIQVEALLHELETSVDETVARTAVVDLAELYSRVFVSSAATPYLQRLQGELADVKLRGDQTGAELAQEFIREYSIRPRPDYKYPTGKANLRTMAANAISTRYAVPVVELGDDSMGPLRFSVIDEQKIVAENEFGRLIWEARIKRDNALLLRMVQGGQRLGTYHHVAVVWTGNHLVGIDALGTEDGGNDREILWMHPLVENTDGVIQQRFQLNASQVNTPWGESRPHYSNDVGQQFGSRPVMFGRQVVAIRGGELVAFDPLTGEQLWIRRGIPSDCDLFGDDEIVYVAAAGNLSARAFAALTGEELPGVSVPTRDERMAYRGKQILRWIPRGEKASIALYDPESGQEVWRRDYEGTVKAQLLDATSELVTLDAAGGVSVIDPATGQLRFQSPVVGLPKMFRLTALADDERYFIGVSAAEPPPGDGRWFAPPIVAQSQRSEVAVIFGQLHCIDRKTGKLLWAHDVEGFGLCAAQPTGGPELVLTGVWSATNVQNARTRSTWNRSGVAIVDKRDGSIIARRTLDQPDIMQGVQISKNPLAHTLQIDTRGSEPLIAFTLTWTDDPPDVDPKLDLKLKASDND